MKDSKKRNIAEMPFYGSMMQVQTRSGIDPVLLLLWHFGFKATPDSCVCGKHEWSAFDLMLESVATGDHGWDFYRNYSTTVKVPDTFRTAVLDSGLTCPSCGVRSGPIEVLYNYATQCCPT